MGRWYRLVVIFLCFAVACLDFVPSAFAEPTDDEMRMLLQKNLTIHEIDQEVSRLSEQETSIAEKIKDTEHEIEKQRSLLDNTRQHAGDVIKAYYSGERTSVWMALFSAETISDVLQMYDYIYMVFDHDHKSLERHADHYNQLKQLKKNLDQTQTDLQETKRQFLTQRQRLVSLQNELDGQLKDNPSAETIQKLMELLTQEWDTKGLPLFRQYFNALASAMKHLPDMLKDNENMLGTDGSFYTFQITDRQLNDFLLEKNSDLFQHFHIQFIKKQMVVTGSHNQVDIMLKGSYTVQDKPNAIRFTIDEMTFNGFALPDTTRNALQKQFNLGFYPQNLAPFLKATDVEIKKGKMKVFFKLNL